MGGKRLWINPLVLDTANRLAPLLLLMLGLSFGLQLILTKFGQAEDLMLTVSDDLTHSFFFSVSLALFTLTNWAIAALSLESVAIPGRLKITLASVSSVIGPLIVALAYPERGTVGWEMANLTGIFLPAGMTILWMRPDYRRKLTVETAMKVMAVSVAPFYAFCGIVLLLFFPDSFTVLVGPVAVLLLIGVAIIWLVWFIASIVPALGVVLLLVFLLALFSGKFGALQARTVAATQPRPSSLRYAENWLRGHPGVRPIFITSDGGGIRSAYWTATVLGALAKDVPAFAHQVYLASGVSGGSVGVAVFAVLPDEQQSRDALAHDFLAAPLGRLLLRDPLDGVFCHGWGWGITCSGTDRQQAAEAAFERECPRLAQPIDAPLPFALALNMTNAASGERMVASNIQRDDTADVLSQQAAGQTLRLSTAMLLSARFPVISPTGLLVLNGKPVRIVDGGYADNSGGAAAGDYLRDLLRVANGAPLKPLWVMITNDSVRSVNQFCEAPAPRPATDPTSLFELASTPIGTLDAGRQHTSEVHRQEFRQMVEQAGGSVAEIPLFRCKADNDPEFPLGWSLSEMVRQHIDLKLERLRKQEDGPYRAIVRALTTKPSQR